MDSSDGVYVGLAMLARLGCQVLALSQIGQDPMREYSRKALVV